VNWAYVIMEDRMYLEEVRQRWPERGFLVRAKAMSKADTSGDNGFRLPDGPMSVVGGLPDQKSIGDGRVKVRWLYAKDPSVEEIKVNPEVQKQIEKLQQIVLPTRRPMFPNGRLVIECEGIILSGWRESISEGAVPSRAVPWEPRADRLLSSSSGQVQQVASRPRRQDVHPVV
jgi:hypothetical protein